MAFEGKQREPGEAKAFWLTYVPPGGDFSDYDEAVRSSRVGWPYDDTWQVRFNNLTRGTRVFVMRQGDLSQPGKPPRGIIARGITRSDSYESTFNRDGTGKKTFRVMVRLDSVVGADETPVKDPFYPFAGRSYGGPAYSGFPIRQTLLDEVEAQWAERFDKRTGASEGSADFRAERDRIRRNILERRGQATFREALLEAYGRRCAITGCFEEEALEAAHIIPCSANGDDSGQNGLLLRCDIHTLFDLDLIRIEPDTRLVRLFPKMVKGYYRCLEGERLKEDQVPRALRAGNEALRKRLQLFSTPWSVS